MSRSTRIKILEISFFRSGRWISNKIVVRSTTDNLPNWTKCWSELTVGIFKPHFHSSSWSIHIAITTREKHFDVALITQLSIFDLQPIRFVFSKGIIWIKMLVNWTSDHCLWWNFYSLIISNSKCSTWVRLYYSYFC